MNKLAVILAAVAMSGCVSATADEPSLCDSQQLSFTMPTIPAVPSKYITMVNGDCKDVGNYAVPVIAPITQSTTVDISDAINKVTQNLDSYSISLNQLALTALSVTDFGDWADVDVVATMSVANEGGSSLPPFTFTYTVPQGNVSELDFNPGLTPDQIIAYFSQGPVTLSFTFNIKLQDACSAATFTERFATEHVLSANANVCVGASGTVNKSL